MGSGPGLHHELSVTDDQFSLDADDMGSGRGLHHELSVTDERSSLDADKVRGNDV